MIKQDTEKTGRISRRLGRMETDQSTWGPYWQDCADYAAPNKNNIVQHLTVGDRRNEDLYDSTAIRAADKLAASLFGYITPYGEHFFKMSSSIPQLNDIEEVGWWYSECTRIILEILFKSNYAMEMHEDYLDSVIVGTSNLYMESDPEHVVTFKSHPIQTYYIMQGANGRIDVVYRVFPFTARQAAQEFGFDNLSPEMQKVLTEAGQNIDREFTFVHAIEPRADHDPRSLDSKAMKYSSVYMEKKSQFIVREGGYNRQPYIVSRYNKSNNEVYGRSPTMDVLPEIKGLNQIRQTVLRASSKKVDPPIFMSDDTMLNRVRLDEGAINYMRRNRYADKPFVLDTKGDIQVGRETINDERIIIREAYHSDLWDLLGDRKNMTAQEVVTRADGQLRLFSPIFSRLTAEKLSPTIHGVFEIAAEQGKLPQPPDIIKEYPDYQIEYVSKVAMAIKMLDIDSTAQTLTMIQPFAAIDPTVMDNFNFNTIARGMAQRKGMPLEFVNTPEQVDGIRTARSAQAEEAERMNSITKGADAVSKLQSATDPTSPLAQMSEEAPI